MSIYLHKQETAEDGMAGLQSKFQNLNAKVNQMLTDGRTDGRTDKHTDRRTSSIYKPELLCNPAKYTIPRATENMSKALPNRKWVETEIHMHIIVSKNSIFC